MLISTEMGVGGDHITKYGTHISRDMMPGGGPISTMIWASPAPCHQGNGAGGGGGGGGVPFHYYITVQSYLKSISLYS